MSYGVTISPQELMDAATTKAGLCDFGDDGFLGPLSAWANDLDNRVLSPKGRAFLERLVVNDLVRRLRIIDCLKQNPQIEETPIPPILYITGHERSGTTLLHNLLAEHDHARFLSRWELMMPSPPPVAETFRSDPRRARMQSSIDALRGTELESMHWVDAHDPEECVWGFMDCTGLLGQAPALIMPTWSDWLDENDLTPTFESYRKIIQMLTWKNPLPENGFLVLKAPQNSGRLTAFAAAFPEACFVFTHRDPFRVITSTAMLVDIVNRPFLEDEAFFARREESERALLRIAKKKFAEMQRFEDMHPERVTNVRYADLVEHPAEVVSSVFGSTDFVPDSDLEGKVNAFIERQRAGRRATPRGEISDFGYVQDAVLADPEIAAYLKRYGVEPERKRQTGAT